MKLPLTPPLKTSYWLETAEAGRPAPTPLAGNHKVDFLMVGGGFVGLWTALTLKQLEPGARVMLGGPRSAP